MYVCMYNTGIGLILKECIKTCSLNTVLVALDQNVCQMRKCECNDLIFICCSKLKFLCESIILLNNSSNS